MSELKDINKVIEDQKRVAEHEGRRTFLFRLMGMTATGLFVNILGSGSAVANKVTDLPPEGYNWDEHRYAYIIDTTKCIGCGMCVRACKNENNVPDHFYRTWIEHYLIAMEEGDYDVQVTSPDGGLFGFEPVKSHLAVTKGFFVPKMCNHCAKAPCVQVCPVGASYQTHDGVVLVDSKRCMGCGYCVQACPYGARFMDPTEDEESYLDLALNGFKNQRKRRHHTASKCTWCYHRITKGLRPACVQACPTGTRQFGDLKRADDPVVIALANTRIQVLQPDLLTKPHCYYIGLDTEVR